MTELFTENNISVDRNKLNPLINTMLDNYLESKRGFKPSLKKDNQ